MSDKPVKHDKPCLLITGAGGFVGNHVMQDAYFQRHYQLCPLEHTDLTDRQAVTDAITALRPNAVLHLAAQSRVDKAFADPVATAEVNIMGSLHLLDALKNSGFTGRLLHVSTGDVYGVLQAADLPVSETHLPRPANPYAASKLAAEALVQAYAAQGQFSAIIARPFNHIGVGQAAGFVVTDTIARLATLQDGDTLPLSYGSNSRDFLCVSDVIAAYAALLGHGNNGAIYNICSGREIRIDALVEALITASGKHISISDTTDYQRPVNQPRVVGDHSKLRRDTGWQAQHNLTDTLTAMWQAHIEYQEKTRK